MRHRLVAALLCLGLVAVACGSNENPIAVESNEQASSDGTTGPTGTDTAPSSSTADTDPSSPPTEGSSPTLPADPSDTTTPEDSTPASTDAPADDPFNWQTLDDDRVQVGSLEVPIDYDDPSAGSFDLFVARHLADPDQRIGSLLVNPGGPGFGGSDYGLYADQVYSEDLLEHFDIIGWDPRGTGQTTPAIDCVDDYDRYFASTDITPDTPEERQQIIDLAQEFEDFCVSKNADILQHVGTNDSARDMDSIRRALGEDKISYFGFSYGSELGATWTTLFPDTVRAAVLDGASDPNADYVTSGLQQTAGFEKSIDEFLAECSADADCPFHNDGNSEKAFDDLMASLDETPIPSVSGRPDVTRGVALSAVGEAMYSETLWPALEQALADAQDGDGEGLLELYDEYFQRQPDGTYDNSLEAFQTISCMDDPDRLTVEEEDATAAEYIAAAPRFAPGTTGSYFCTFYPKPDDPRVAITGAGAGPILVVGTTGDPATPLSSTENMAKTLEQGVLLVVVANQHTGYGVNECSYDTIDGYLVDLTVPESGKRCE